MERVGLVAMTVVLALSAAGAFGDGPLARRERATADGAARVHWERVVRTGHATTLRIASDAADTLRAVLLPAALLDRFRLEAATPAPHAQRATGAGVELRLALGAGGEAELRLEPQGPGRVRDTVRIDGAPVPIDILVLP